MKPSQQHTGFLAEASSPCPSAPWLQGRRGEQELNRTCDCKAEVHRDRLNANISSQVKKALRVRVKNPLRDAVPRSFIIPEALTNTQQMDPLPPTYTSPPSGFCWRNTPERLPQRAPAGNQGLNLLAQMIGFTQQGFGDGAVALLCCFTGEEPGVQKSAWICKGHSRGQTSSQHNSKVPCFS